MPKFTIITSEECIQYWKTVVEADTEEEAIKKLLDGNCLTESLYETDYSGEIMDIQQINDRVINDVESQELLEKARGY